MKPWTITFEDRAWTDEDVTTAHAVAVAELIGDSWDAVSPWSGPKSLAAWLTVLLTADLRDMEKALAAVYALPIGSLTDCLAGRDVTPPTAAAA